MAGGGVDRDLAAERDPDDADPAATDVGAGAAGMRARRRRPAEGVPGGSSSDVLAARPLIPDNLPTV
jgi:hypothetical protein